VHEQILARSRDATQRALAAAAKRTVSLEVDGVGHVTASDRYCALAEHPERVSDGWQDDWSGICARSRLDGRRGRHEGEDAGLGHGQR
jgi:hypothetical protein